MTMLSIIFYYLTTVQAVDMSCKEQLNTFEVELYNWVTNIYPRLTEFVVRGVDAGCFGLEEKYEKYMSCADDVKHLSILYLMGKYKQWEVDRFGTGCQRFESCVETDVWEQDYTGLSSPSIPSFDSPNTAINFIGGTEWDLLMDDLDYTGPDDPETIVNNIIADPNCKYLGFQIYRKGLTPEIIELWMETANVNSVSWGGTNTDFSIKFDQSANDASCSGKLQLLSATNIATIKADFDNERGQMLRIYCAGEEQRVVYCPEMNSLDNYVNQDLMDCIVEYVKCKGLDINELLDEFTLTNDDAGFGIGTMTLGGDSPCAPDAFTIS
jgi:hypothetical protein